MPLSKTPQKSYKTIEEAIVIRQEEIATDIYEIWVKTEAAFSAVPGQFCNIYTEDAAHILPRPISICDIDTEDGSLRFVYQKKGFGTNFFSTLSSGRVLRLLGPLGNGFPVDVSGDILLVGGGMGVAPLLAVAKVHPQQCTAVLGFREFKFLDEEFKAVCKNITIVTETGRYGIKGTVIDALCSIQINAQTAFLCGPRPMMSTVSSYLSGRDIPIYVSMEERMACGVGACLGCVTDTESGKKCICKDGPVFKDSEVINL